MSHEARPAGRGGCGRRDLGIGHAEHEHLAARGLAAARRAVDVEARLGERRGESPAEAAGSDDAHTERARA